VKRIDVIQGTPEWHAARLGIPTASGFASILAKGEGKMRAAYMKKLANERVTGTFVEGFKSVHTDRGTAMEPEARRAYAFIRDIEPEIVGFCTNDEGTVGASPDSFLGDRGVLEIKTQLPDILAETHDKGVVPSGHIAQLQGVLWVTERDYAEFTAYYTGFVPFIRRVERDDIYIAKLIKEVGLFNEELAELVASIEVHKETGKAA
jgi:hypothetical protein